jgi:hypothetical protein
MSRAPRKERDAITAARGSGGGHYSVRIRARSFHPTTTTDHHTSPGDLHFAELESPEPRPDDLREAESSPREYLSADYGEDD